MVTDISQEFLKTVPPIGMYQKVIYEMVWAFNELAKANDLEIKLGEMTPQDVYTLVLTDKCWSNNYHTARST